MKRLVFCFDGTWNRLDAPHATNVVITAESVLPIASDGVSQAIFYDEGVGTRKGEKLTGGLFGEGIVDNLSDAYRFLIFNHTPGRRDLYLRLLARCLHGALLRGPARHLRPPAPQRCRQGHRGGAAVPETQAQRCGVRQRHDGVPRQVRAAALRFRCRGPVALPERAELHGRIGAAPAGHLSRRLGHGRRPGRSGALQVAELLRPQVRLPRHVALALSSRARVMRWRSTSGARTSCRRCGTTWSR